VDCVEEIDDSGARHRAHGSGYNASDEDGKGQIFRLFISESKIQRQKGASSGEDGISR